LVTSQWIFKLLIRKTEKKKVFIGEKMTKSYSYIGQEQDL